MRLMILLALMMSTRNGDVYLREGAVAAALKGLEGKIPRVETPVTSTVIMLEPVEQIIHGLELNHKTGRALYEEVGRAAGIHVRFDSGVAVDLPVEGLGSLSESFLEGALDYVAFATKTSWKAINGDTIVVSARTMPAGVIAVEAVRHYSELASAIRAGAREMGNGEMLELLGIK